MIKALIFDHGGVITYGTSVGDACRTYSKKLNIPIGRVTEVIKRYWKLANIGSISSEDFWASIKRNLNIKESTNHLRELWFSKVNIRKDVLDLIKSLRGKFKLCLLSNITEARYLYTDKKFNTSKNFDFMVLSYKERIAKPDSRIYESALRKMDVKAEECVFIDDLERNLKPAEELGMKTIHFKNCKQLKKDLLRAIKF